MPASDARARAHPRPHPAVPTRHMPARLPAPPQGTFATPVSAGSAMLAAVQVTGAGTVRAYGNGALGVGAPGAMPR